MQLHVSATVMSYGIMRRLRQCFCEEEAMVSVTLFFDGFHYGPEWFLSNSLSLTIKSDISTLWRPNYSIQYTCTLQYTSTCHRQQLQGSSELPLKQFLMCNNVTYVSWSLNLSLAQYSICTYIHSCTCYHTFLCNMHFQASLASLVSEKHKLGKYTLHAPSY